MNQHFIKTIVAGSLVGLAIHAAHAAGPELAPLQGAAPPSPTPSGTGEVLPKPQRAGPSARPAPGGPKVTVSTIDISGNTHIDSVTLLSSLGDVLGKAYDLSGLWDLADAVERQYRIAGYPFSQAWVPPQDLKSGALKINVLEGRYGKITAVQKDDLPEGAQDFLDYNLFSGQAIQAKLLERTMLILDDQPGVRVQPHLHPGAAEGDGNLTVAVERSSNVSGEVGLDNIGSQSTGATRLRGTLNINSPFSFGDRIALSGLYTNENMLLGSVEYERPLGASGLRGGLGYAHTSYVLAGDYANLDAKGIADITTARLSYPLVRSQVTNVWLSLAYQNKKLQDRFNAIPLVKDKSSESFPLGLQFDNRDAFAGGGVTYGYFTWTSGRLSLDAASAAAEANSAKTQGGWNKFTLDIARIQNLPADFRLYGRVSSQWADKNLDSSEKLGVSGFYGVRAYPNGESLADSGVLAQLELRYVMGAVTPFVFYDQANSRLVNYPWDSTAATRNLSGSGFGMRYLDSGWSIDATVAWRGDGPALSETDRTPRVFLMATKRF